MVVALELGDIHWRSGELVVHGKGQMVEHVPLPSEVGEAIAMYLRDARGASVSRRVFLRMWAPRVGLAGPAAIGHIVRLAFARAGYRLHRTFQGGRREADLDALDVHLAVS